MTRLLALELSALAIFAVAWSAWLGTGLAGFVAERLTGLLRMLE